MQSRQVTVDDTGAELVTANRGPKQVIIRIPGALATETYVGASGVTDTTGFQLDPGEEVNFRIRQDDSVHAICAAGASTTVHVLDATGHDHNALYTELDNEGVSPKAKPADNPSRSRPVNVFDAADWTPNEALAALGLVRLDTGTDL